ncbi:MAG: sigma-70 family RNA polymerase sigma factor [Chitinophagaceae bacterium]|nr:sigma-70 family RNA polymerase sigma factor [Chitinophagaceae bacterium]
MHNQINSEFLEVINQNIGIAHKVCRIYFQNADERDDVMQEMMYQLWRSYHRFDGHSKFSTWMYSVCLNTALTYKRKTIKHQAEPLSESHHQIADPNSGTNLEDTRLLYDAIATLSPLNKGIILLYLENMSYEEMASITGLTKSNVSVKLVRIKKELELRLSKNLNP